jgi:hypothetical protein
MHIHRVFYANALTCAFLDYRAVRDGTMHPSDALLRVSREIGRIQWEDQFGSTVINLIVDDLLRISA